MRLNYVSRAQYTRVGQAQPHEAAIAEYLSPCACISGAPPPLLSLS